jgi:hypothetical protein
MKVPFRLRVLRALTEVIEGVNPDNGYENDLRGKVFRGRAVYDDNDPLPMVSIMEPPIPLEVMLSRESNPNSTGDWELLIQGFVPDDPANPSDPAHILMAEVKSVLAKEKKRDRGRNIFGIGYGSGGSAIVDMEIGQGSVRPGDDTSAYTFFWLTLTLKLSENLEDPYA